jgi:hypothetical protein
VRKGRAARHRALERMNSPRERRKVRLRGLRPTHRDGTTDHETSATRPQHWNAGAGSATSAIPGRNRGATMRHAASAPLGRMNSRLGKRNVRLRGRVAASAGRDGGHRGGRGKVLRSRAGSGGPDGSVWRSLRMTGWCVGRRSPLSRAVCGRGAGGEGPAPRSAPLPHSALRTPHCRGAAPLSHFRTLARSHRGHSPDRGGATESIRRAITRSGEMPSASA